MSEQVEVRLVELLKHPTESPYGNPIPGLSELGESADDSRFLEGVVSLSGVVPADGSEARVVIRRIAEELQKDVDAMSVLRRVGVLPGNDVTISRSGNRVVLSRLDQQAELADDMAAHLFVSV
jgi:DtxR family Mn-dependent transcriptional regulator